MVYQVTYSRFESIFAVEYEQLWMTEKMYFLENLVKMVEHQLECQPAFDSEMDIVMAEQFQRENTQTYAGVSNNSSPMLEHDVEADRQAADNTKARYWGAKVGRAGRLVCRSCLVLEAKFFEVKFKVIYPNSGQADRRGYIMPFRVVLMESSRGVAMGVKLSIYSATSAKATGMFLPLDPLFFPPPPATVDIQANEDPSDDMLDYHRSLHHFFDQLSWDSIFHAFHFETICDPLANELQIARHRPVIGREIMVQSLDSVLDLTAAALTT